LFGLHAQAQSWQWGAYAGSRPTTGSGNTVSGLALDVHGNTYITADVGPKGIYVGSLKLPDVKGSGLNLNTALLVSHDCNGKTRWTKRLSGAYVATKGLKVSKSGRVYVFGVLSSSVIDSVYYDTDAVCPNVNQAISLVCYDTMGKFQWLQRPDTIIGSSTHYYPIAMDIDDTGNVYCLLSMPPGNKILGSSLTIPTTVPYYGEGLYVLKYNPLGKLLSVTMLQDISYTNYYLGIAPQMFFTYNPFNRGFYLAGRISLDPGNDSLFLDKKYVNHNMYLASFAPDGKLKWYQTDTSVVPNFAYIIGPVVPDKTGDIYIGGSLPHSDMFGGYRAENPLLPSRNNYMPFLMKADSMGNTLWAVSGGADPSTFSAAIAGGFIAINQSYAAIGGTGGLKAYFGDPFKDTFTINYDKPGGPGMDGWYALVNLSTRKTEKIGLVNGGGVVGGVYKLQFYNDNLIIAGNSNSVSDTVDKELLIGPKMSSSGQDAFIAKYSLPCGCMIAPIASFDYSSSSGIFSFTGTSPADSVTWDFGDGGKGKGTTLSHAYATAGKYTVCATVWTRDCGKKKICKDLNIITSIGTVMTGASPLQLYPNPAREQLTVSGLPGSGVLRLRNMQGQVVQTVSYVQDELSLNLQGLPAGMYLLETFAADGARFAGRFIKE
jgi:hypothetical protein